MDESYETFEEDLGPQRVDYPPPKPIRPIRRPEMYATRKTKEEMASGPQQIKAEPKILPREPSFNRSSSIQQSVSTQTEVPLESVTLNRCLFIVITILVLTSGFQRLHEALHGHGVAFGEEEDEFGLAVRRSGALRHRTKPETSLWEVVLSWLPDLDDDDDDDEEDDDNKDVEIKKRKPKLRTAAKSPSSLRNKQLPGKKLLKQRDCKIKGRQGKKSLQDEIQEEEQEFLEEADNEHEEEENEEKELISFVEKKRKKLSKG